MSLDTVRARTPGLRPKTQEYNVHGGASGGAPPTITSHDSRAHERTPAAAHPHPSVQSRLQTPGTGPCAKTV
jgi:hypothetical protein